MNYFIIVSKNNGNSGEYESGFDEITLDSPNKDEAIEDLISYGESFSGYTNGNSGSPAYKYELTLWTDINESGEAEPIKSVYTDNYK